MEIKNSTPIIFLGLKRFMLLNYLYGNDMTTKPLVTVMTSYYNDQDFLANAISSVLEQTYTNFEYILVNHASTDKSRKIAHSFKDPRIKHIDMPINYGASGNILIQKALEQAQGTYLKTLCADDMLLPDGLEKLLKKAQEQEADLVFGDVRFVNANKQPTGRTWFKNRYPAHLPVAEYLRKFINGTSYFPYAGNFIKIETLKQVSFDYVSVQLADIGIWIEMLFNGAKLAFTDEPVADYRIHNKQMCNASQLDVIGKRCVFEHLLFCEHYFNAKTTLELLKQVFSDDPFVSKLTAQDTPLIPFAIAQAIYRLGPNKVYKLAARKQIADCLNNYSLQQLIEKKFNYTLKDLRNDIVMDPFTIIEYSSQTLKRASFGQLSYYFFRKIAHILLLKEWKEKRKRKRLLKSEDGVV